MSVTPQDLYELLQKIRYDATAIQAKVTDALNALNDLNLPDAESLLCPEPMCGLPMRGPKSLAEHLYVSHGGPLPPAYAAVDAIAQDPEDWVLTFEQATPLYIGSLPHYIRRMVQALDAYWLHCDGLPKGRYPRSRSTAEDWWGRFEKYRALVEEELTTTTAKRSSQSSDPGGVRVEDGA